MKKIYFRLIIGILISVILTGCSPAEEKKIIETNNDYLLLATLFQQHAAEKRALSYQAFNTARMMLDRSLKSARLTKKLAVVVDIDETVLDNSPFEAKSIIENTSYPKYWKEWCEQASAETIAGSVDFLLYAESQGVDVFYITNRKEELKEVTLQNLQEKGFPFADEKHILMRTETSNKEPRRKLVEKTHHIVILMGDNLGDFLNDFDDISNAQRFALTDSLKYEFGRRFIMLPNPMYGSWLGELYNNDNDLPKAKKIKLMKSHLKSF